MAASAQGRPAIPDFLSHLQVFNGLPVPFTQAIIDGVPDLRATDFEKILLCVERKICGICGRRLGEYAYFIGGPLTRDNHLFTDPGMHSICAEFASKTCPFVSGRTAGYSKRPIEGMVSTQRPQGMYVLKTRTKDFHGVKMGHGLAVQTGNWISEQKIE